MSPLGGEERERAGAARHIDDRLPRGHRRESQRIARVGFE